MSIRNAASASYIDVNNAVNGGGPHVGIAPDGTTIIIPADPGIGWSEQLKITRGIKLQGQTTVSGAGTSGCTANDQTVIINNAVGKPNLIQFSITALQSAEVCNLTLQGGSVKSAVISLTSTGSSPVMNMNVHDIHCINSSFITTGGWVYGVAHHNLIEAAGQTFFINTPSYAGKILGHGAWNDFPWFGTEKFFFCEDNTLINTSLFATKNNLDGENGARAVFRHNYCHNSRPGWHGTEGGNRGTRAMEVYNNFFHWTIPPSSSNRSGSALVYDNTFDGHDSDDGTFASMTIFREGGAVTVSNPWDFADGTSPWDSNDPHGVYYSGTATGGTIAGAGTATLTVAGNPWTAHQWIGYSVKNIDSVTCAGKSSHIVENTTNQITYSYYGDTDRGPNLKFVNGDNFTISRVLIALDQPGRGKGDLISGNLTAGFVNTALGNVPAWPRQALEPCIFWNNHYTPTNAYWSVKSGDPTLVENRDYFNFGASGGLAKAISTYVAALNGVDYTGPYTYPHPLQGNVTPIISSPSSANFTELVAGSFPVTTSGFSGTVTFSKTGSLPSAVTLNNSTGLISGTPAAATAGSYPITIHATDGTDSYDQNFTLVVAAATTRVIALSGSMAFGFVTIGTTASRNLTITNNGNGILTVSLITYPTGFTGDWSGGTIAVGASKIVSVTFSPITGISYSGTITVASDKTSGTNTTAASGTGATRVIGLSGDLAFGNITTGQTATRQLTITNSGNTALAISSISYPEGFSGDFTTDNIAAGASDILNVTFSPTAVQAYGGSIGITSDKTSGPTTFAASGAGVATPTKIIQLTGDLNFGSVQTGTTQSRVLAIVNSGTATLTVTSITLPTGFSGDWSSGTIAAGATHNVNVTFAPVAAISYSGTVTVASDATSGTNTTSASGTGSVATTRIIALSGSLAFGNVLSGSSANRTLTLTNNGTADLTVTSLTLPTGFSATFSGAIAPGASQPVTITFSPSAVQVYSGTVTVNSDATSGTNTIAASGTGVAPTTRIISLAGNLSFGNVQKQHTAQQIFTITNSGTAALSVTNVTAPTGFTVNWTSGSIAPGATQSVTVTFQPTAVQAYSGNITVVSNKTSGANTIPCSGVGTLKKKVPFILIVG